MWNLGPRTIGLRVGGGGISKQIVMTFVLVTDQEAHSQQHRLLAHAFSEFREQGSYWGI